MILYPCLYLLLCTFKRSYSSHIYSIFLLLCLDFGPIHYSLGLLNLILLSFCHFRAYVFDDDNFTLPSNMAIELLLCRLSNRV